LHGSSRIGTSTQADDIPSIPSNNFLLTLEDNNHNDTSPKVAYITHAGNEDVPWIPRSISTISKSPNPEKWTLALTEEINSLIDQNVFDMSPIDISTIPTTSIIPSQVIFDICMNADGTVNKYKARLVAQGNHQHESTFFDTFADTASAKSINILFSIAAAASLYIFSLDIKTAFLYIIYIFLYILPLKSPFIYVVLRVYLRQ